MSYTLFSDFTHRAKKPHKCIWCAEPIEVKSFYKREKSVYDGHFQDHKWHEECFDAAQRYFAEYHEEEFDPHSFKRGTAEEN